MQFFDFFETRLLFGVVRFLFLVMIFGLLALIVLGAINLRQTMTTPEIRTKVSPSEVLAMLQTAPGNPSSSGDANTNDELDGLKFSGLLKQAVSDPTIHQQMNTWLKEVPVAKRQEFIDEMSSVMDEASKEYKDEPREVFAQNFDNAIGKYVDIKMDKIHAQEAAKENRQQQYKMYAIGASIAIALISLFALVLVMLAIERNTRHHAA